MNLPPEAYLKLRPDLTICRILNGMWQVSGAHGTIEPRAALAAMHAHFEAGFTTFDLADHYGPAEDLIGAFQSSLSAQAGTLGAANFRAFTKWVPRPAKMSRQVVEEAVNTSLRRMNTPALDMLQFHWWEYSDERYLDALQHLADLQAAGKIRYLALTNFDTAHLQKILDRQIPIVSNQVQFSLVDQRPLEIMTELCRAHNVWLLTYGTVCGGLLSEKYLNQPEPRGSALSTVSLRKYKQMIDLWGGWSLFQNLLTVLAAIANRHNSTIANVATRFILDRPQVGGVILGVRFGLSQHIVSNSQVFALRLDDTDLSEIQAVTARGRELFQLIGDCGDEYRR